MLLAMEQLAVTTLRNVVGSMTLEETLTSRDQINTQLRIVLDEATEKWGVRVTRVELKSIDPPRSIQEAMEQQMRADRAKRATVLQAEGEKQSAILRAEGLRAGGDPERRGRPAGERAAGRGRPPGPGAAGAGRGRGAAARSSTMVQSAGIDPANVLGYKYLEALPAVAAGDANKLLLLPDRAPPTRWQRWPGLGAAFSEGGDAATREARPASARRTPTDQARRPTDQSSVI